MPNLHIPRPDEALIDVATGRPTERFLRLLRDFNQRLNALTFADISGVTTAAQVGLHASKHQAGGTDAIKLDDLATPDDNTDLNASTTRHGLLPKLSGNAAQSLRGDGTWA